MKTQFIALCFIFTAFVTFSYAQQVITVTDASGQNSRVYDVLDSAIAHSIHGDFVYLPGGSFDITRLNVNKGINIIGAGYRTDSAGATGITLLGGTLSLITGASNGSLTGVYITGDLRFGTTSDDMEVSNYTVTRCSMNQYQLGVPSYVNNSKSKNVSFSECVFRGPWNYASYVTNVKIEKSIFNGRVFYQNNGGVFSNNIFLFRSAGWPVLNDISNNLLYNNIFLQDVLVTGINATNIFNNNLFAKNTFAANLGGSTQANNVFDFTVDNIFIGAKEADFYYSLERNYHLEKAAIDALKGTDGKQVGIYGTDFPFKDGAMPVNPHVSYKSIAPSTNSEGKLQININVKAQSY